MVCCELMWNAQDSWLLPGFCVKLQIETETRQSSIGSRHCRAFVHLDFMF